MTASEKKAHILSNLRQHSIDILVEELAQAAVKIEALEAEVASLKAQLSPKPEA